MYLVAYYYQKPAHDRVRTSKAGWMKQPGSMAWDEQVALTIRLKNKDISMAKVILDLRGRKVVRNALNDNRDYDGLFDYYVKNYPQHAELMKSVNTAVQNQTAKPTAFAPVVTSEVRVVDTPSL